MVKISAYYFCPLCDKEVAEWGDYSGRKNVSCPNCNSAERHRLASLFFKNKNIVYNDFLHIAPEKPLQKLFQEKSKNYICGDLNPERYSHLNAIYLDATDMSLKDNSIDCIYASHVLEHIIEDRKAMSEMYRVLKDGGVLLTMIPQKMDLIESDEDYTINTPEGRKKRYGQWDHVRYYGLDFSERLKQCGFYVEIYYGFKNQEKYIKKMTYDEKHLITDCSDRYNAKEIIYVCTKKDRITKRVKNS